MNVMSSEIQPLSNLQNYSNDLFYDEKFMLVLERHLPILKDTANPQPVKRETAMRYKGDFFGLCVELKLPFDYHYVIMRMNGLRNNLDFDGKIDQLLIPEISTITKIVQLHSQIQKMS